MDLYKNFEAMGLIISAWVAAEFPAILFPLLPAHLPASYLSITQKAYGF